MSEMTDTNPLSIVQFTHPHFKSTSSLPYRKPQSVRKTETRVLTDKARGVAPNKYRQGTATGKTSAKIVGEKKAVKNGSSGHHSGATLQVHDMPQLMSGQFEARKLGG